MPETARIWVETSFNILYLVVVWWLVIAMFSRRSLVAASERKAADLLLWAFFLLGLGDVGHVGFRVVAFALGGLDTSVNFFGTQLKLAPMGALATAITFTFFYVAMIMLWKAHFGGKYGFLGWSVFVLAVIRLLLMTHPANGWNSIEAQMPWAVYRNLPLMLMQLAVAFLLLRDAAARQDRAFKWMGIMILVSFACYAPVIFLQALAPLVGMLMIPKTVAYLVIAFIGLSRFFRKVPPQEPAGVPVV